MLKNEFEIMFACRNETMPEHIGVWITALAQIQNLSFQELIMRIRVARITKRFGTRTTLADIMDDDEYWVKYRDYYKKEEKE